MHNNLEHGVNLVLFQSFIMILPQASKAGLRIYRPGKQMEEEESQGWLSWMWNWGGEAEAQTKEVKTGSKTLNQTLSRTVEGTEVEVKSLPKVSHI